MSQPFVALVRRETALVDHASSGAVLGPHLFGPIK
jgi:hypothetical protein